MQPHPSFHLFYIPGDDRLGTKDKVLGLCQTEDIDYVRSVLDAVPESIALELEATDQSELQSELLDLGFDAIPPWSTLRPAIQARR